ncbi:ABC transporter substrate-binding protein [Brevundimonas halotolerans]|uniref:NitT/TauT family transport system substrate-binding protein n=1 Tax=Brevundimonas halotolerans TaxID=69670 RepID=A0A7W9E674_9CAUL|nr:ABC transporter substrate-binding protein [Brevundimonas halotolerans]MBB5660007.1 NitT/TauT family transport system substrate-binding protein [Brevundimonas halotolerans]
MRRPPVRFATLDRRILLTGAAALGLSATVAACGSSEPAIDENGRVRLRLAVGDPAGAELGGFYQALATGLYEARGLNVQLVRPGFGQDVPRALASGKAELGLVADSFTALRLVEEEAPVKAVAVFFQKSPRALIRHAEAGPAAAPPVPPAPAPVQVAEADRDTLWPWFRTLSGFTDDQLADHDLEAFIRDPNALMLGHVTREPVLIPEAGGAVPTSRLLFEDGFASYGALVLAPTAFARDNDEALRAFIAASVEGWAAYIEGDPDPAHTLIRRANRAMTTEQLEQARDALLDAALVTGDAPSVSIGSMSADRWRTFYESASEAGVFPAGLDWQQAFTTDYLSPAVTPAPAS